MKRADELLSDIKKYEEKFGRESKLNEQGRAWQGQLRKALEAEGFLINGPIYSDKREGGRRYKFNVSKQGADEYSIADMSKKDKSRADKIVRSVVPDAKHYEEGGSVVTYTRFVGSEVPESKLKEQEKESYRVAASGIEDKDSADEVARKEGGVVVADEEDPKKFQVIVKESKSDLQTKKEKLEQQMKDSEKAYRKKMDDLGKQIDQVNQQLKKEK